ncbi:MAG: SCP2 sterol-binding domain-containing protein [Candidatus Hodarchaeota archaeon]
MVKYGTQEFADAYREALNKNENYKEAAADWEGDFVWVATPSGALDHEQRMWIGLHHGKCTGAKKLEPEDKVRLLKPGEKRTGGGYEVEYVYTTDYETWKKITMGEVDAIRAMLSGKAKLDGDMAKILKYTRAAAELTVSAQTLDIEWF